MINYYQGNVPTNSADPWVNCQADPDNSRCTSGWLEGKRKSHGLYGRDGREFLALEQCNFVSNMAYYRSVTRLCAYDNWQMDESYRKALK